MKKLVALCLVFTLVFTMLVSASATTTIDYSYIKSRSDVFTFNINDSGNAFVDLDIDYPKFTHKNSPDGYSSLFYSDIIITDYYKSPKAVWRIWIEYTAKKNLGISSVSFTLHDTEYVFNVASDNKTSRTDDYVLEQIPLVMGTENMMFWFFLLLELESCDSYEDFENIHIPVKLSGAIDDVTFDIPTDGLCYLYFIGEAMYNMVGLEGITETDGAAYTTIDHTPAATEAPVTE